MLSLDSYKRYTFLRNEKIDLMTCFSLKLSKMLYRSSKLIYELVLTWDEVKSLKYRLYMSMRIWQHVDMWQPEIFRNQPGPGHKWSREWQAVVAGQDGGGCSEICGELQSRGPTSELSGTRLIRVWDSSHKPFLLKHSSISCSKLYWWNVIFSQ